MSTTDRTPRRSWLSVLRNASIQSKQEPFSPRPKVECSVSYGRGGAGNLRRVSDTRKARKYLKDLEEETSVEDESRVDVAQGTQRRASMHSIMERFRRTSKDSGITASSVAAPSLASTRSQISSVSAASVAHPQHPDGEESER